MIDPHGGAVFISSESDAPLNRKELQ